MFRKLRVAILLYVLFIVAITSWSTRARNTEWIEPLWVAVYPINAEHSEPVERYIRRLTEEQFTPIESVMQAQASVWGIDVTTPIDIKFAPQIDSLPPTPPQSSNPLAIAYWSLRLRFWAWRNDSFDGPKDIRIFVAYYDPQEHATLAHSLGLQQGFLGVVNAYGDSDYDGRNNVVIAHEMLHTLGASDKYDPQTNAAQFPDGFAEPDRSPRYPQQLAELMAGRIPRSASESTMPNKLRETVIGQATAREIGWLK